MAKPDDTPSMALFCDFENVALGVRDAKYEKFDIRRVLERLLLKGSIVVKKAYCDWARYREFKAEMHEASFELIEIPHVRQSGKNSADIRMVVDALDLCYTKSHVDTFVIISGDSDFSPLVSKLRENAKTVIGVGVKGSTSDLLTANCDEFIFYDDLVREHRRRGAQGAARRETPREPARDAGRDSGREGSRDGNREGGRDAGRGGRGNGAGRGPDRDAPREPLRVVPASARAEPGDEASSVVGGPWRRHAPEPREPAIADARDPVPDAGSAFDATATFTAADFAAEDLAAARGATGGNADDALDAARDDALDAARDDARDDDAPDDAARDDADAVEPAAAADDEARAPARRPRRSRARAAAVDGATDASVAAAAPGPDEAAMPADASLADAAVAAEADPDAAAPAADAPKKRAPRRRKAAAAAVAPAEAAETADVALDAIASDASPLEAIDDAPADAAFDAPASLEPERVEPTAPRRSEEERRQEAIDLAVETVEALIGERGADDKIWGSMVKQTLKRRRPGFAESYYGYRSFNDLLEDARDRGLLALEHDEKSGGYVIRLL